MTIIGSEEKIKALKFIHKEMVKMERKHSVYITTFFNEYGQILKSTMKVGDINHRNYLLWLVYNDYVKKCDELATRPVLHQYDAEFVSHMKNAVYAKYRIAKNS